MTKGRAFLIGAQSLAVLLFLAGFDTDQHWSSWLVPMVLIVLVVVNSLHFTRFNSWLIFSVSFFAFCVVLSAFTLRFRVEAGFNSMPFYRTMVMYIAFVYVSLGQIKILGGQR